VVHAAPAPGLRLAVADRPRLPSAAARRPLPAEPDRPQPGGPPGDRSPLRVRGDDGVRARIFQQLAGITAYYNTRNWYFLYVTADDEGRAVLRVAARDRGELTVDEAGGELLGDTTRLRLGLDLDESALRFRYDTGPGWRPLGPTLDATVLSDEHAEEMEGDRIRALGFTGAFVGLWAWDLTGGGLPADFDEATYRT
jgi:xylan 1,4-beta-xylosidase